MESPLEEAGAVAYVRDCPDRLSEDFRSLAGPVHPQTSVEEEVEGLLKKKKTWRLPLDRFEKWLPKEGRGT